MDEAPPGSDSGEETTRAGGAQFSGDGWAMLLGLFVAVSPLVIIAAVQTAIDLPNALVAAVVVLSLLLMAGVTLVLRPQALENGGNAPGDRRAPSAAPSTIVAEKDALGPIPRDPLTGLPTFQPFSRRLLKESQYVAHAETTLAIVLVDVNHLGDINSQFGTDVGDQVLLHTTACLQASKRMNDVLARMGDDEFGLLLLNCDEAGARAFVERVQQWLVRESLPVQSKGHKTSLWVGVCAGTAICDPSTVDPDEALTVAVDRLNAAREERDRRRQTWERSA